MRTRLLFAIFALAFAAQGEALAQNVRFQGNKKESAASARILAGYWITEFSGRVKVGDGDESPTRLNLRQDLDLDLDDIGVPFASLTYKDASLFITAKYFYAIGGGKEIAERDFNYDGLHYIQGSFVSSKMTMQSVSVELGYTLFSEWGIDVSIVGGLRYVYYTSKVTQPDAGSRRNTAEAYMPSMGVRFDAEILDGLVLYGDIMWLKFSFGSESFVADHFEWSAGALYNITDYLSIHAEYAYFENHLERDSEDYLVKFKGPRFGIALRF